MKQIDIKIERR